MLRPRNEVAIPLDGDLPRLEAEFFQELGDGRPAAISLGSPLTTTSNIPRSLGLPERRVKQPAQNASGEDFESVGRRRRKWAATTSALLTVARNFDVTGWAGNPHGPAAMDQVGNVRRQSAQSEE